MAVKSLRNCGTWCRASFTCVSISLLFSIFGCNSRPGRVSAPWISPDDAAAEAIQKSDLDNDGLLSERELKGNGSLRYSFASIDVDGDKKLSATEIAARIRFWQESKVALAPAKCRVIYKGQPLVGASVVFEPDTFVSNLDPAFGVTGSDGIAPLSVAEENRPRPEITGVQLGFYRVKISLKRNGAEVVPVQFNEETTLGIEVAPGDMGMYGIVLED